MEQRAQLKELKALTENLVAAETGAAVEPACSLKAGPAEALLESPVKAGVSGTPDQGALIQKDAFVRRHTRGPWVYQVSPLTGKDIQLKRAHWCVGIAGGQGLALVFESEANARLVAASPQLLALAKRYASECAECSGEGCVRDEGSTDCDVNGLVDCEACADIRAVIDKAELLA